jgi:hypothetical protein
MNNNKIKDELRKKYFTAGLVIKKEEQQNIDIYNALKEAREQGASEFSPSNSRNVSGEVKSRVIEVNANYDAINASESLKNNGYDENFKTELYRKKEWEKRDKQFNLVDKEENFTNAYRNSRLPTNSYIHFAEVENGKIETTGHVGGLFKEIDIKDKTPEEIRSESRKYVGKKNGRGNKNARTKGSMEFHQRRQNVIDAIYNEAKNNVELQESSPKKSEIEILKFVINNTVGYRDNFEDNKEKFKGITTNGLNLEDDVSREYAMKHYQATRDTLKLVVLKLLNRFNNYDSEDESVHDELDKEKAINLLNKKLERTNLQDKYHDKNTQKRSLSPVRYASPYSRSNIDITIDSLNRSKVLQDITSIYTAPIPTIRLNEDLIATEKNSNNNSELRSLRDNKGDTAKKNLTKKDNENNVNKKLDNEFKKAEKKDSHNKSEIKKINKELENTSQKINSIEEINSKISPISAIEMKAMVSSASRSL